MRWLYVRFRETEDLIVYLYSMESDELDGEIVYDKRTEAFDVTRPCRKDAGNDCCIERTKQHFRCVIREGFPAKRRVVTG